MAVAPTPRPYGTGPYGIGYYSRYRGTLWDVAGSTLLQLSAQATIQRIEQRQAGRTGITLSPRALGLARDVYIYGDTQIAWNVTARGVETIIRPWAFSQILFDAWAEHLTPSWMLPPPCETGVWTPAAPCETGGWVAPGPCNTGVWTPVRLP